MPAMLTRLVQSPFTGAVLMLASAVWNGLTSADGPVRRPDLSVLAFLLAAGQSFGALLAKVKKLEKQVEPRLELAFRPEAGDPYMVDKRIDNDRVKRIYRVGVANPSAVSVDDVGVLLKSWTPDEQDVRLFHELERMGQEEGRTGSRFKVSGNSPEPRVFVDVLKQTINKTTGKGSMPEMLLARGEYSTQLWKQHQAYKFSLQVDGDGAGPFLGLIYERDDSGVYTLRRNEFAKQ